MTTTLSPALAREREVTIMGLAQVLGWKFTAAQYEILCHLTRFVAISGGDRSGKSVFTARWCMVQIVEYLSTIATEIDAGRLKTSPETILGVLWLVAANYEKTWQEYSYLRDDMVRYYGREAVSATDAVDPGRLTLSTPFGKLLVRTKSATDEGSLVMEGPFAVAVVEAAQIPYGAYLRLQGRVSEKRAPILLSGSLEQDIGWYPSLVDRWESPAIWATEDSRSWRVPSDTNIFAFPGGENDPEILREKRLLPENEFNRRFRGKSSPPKGLVHPLFKMAVHVRNVDFLPDETVYLGIDPGIAGPAAGGSSYAIVCCQYFNGQLRVFDLIHESDKTEEFIIKFLLMDPNTGKPWFKKIASRETNCIAVIDRAGATRTGAHEASVEVWRKTAGLNLLYTERAIPVQDQIRRFDSFLQVNGVTGEPGLVIDTKCEGLLAELGGTLDRRYDPPSLRAYQWNLNAQGELVGNEPRPRYCDAIKALSYLLVHQWGYATAQSTRTSIRVIRRRRRRAA